MTIPLEGGAWSPASLRAMKGVQQIAALTAYDFPNAKLLDEAGVPFILVGDSLGMVVLGLPDTTGVTMEDMEHHTRAVARGVTRSLVGADLPFGSYDTSERAVVNARRLIASGAQAVKAEGGREIQAQARAITEAGIPFVGHLGMLPQHVLEEGGYYIKGKTEASRIELIDSARALEQAGAFAIVLELVTPAVAAEITRSVGIPTIGIGSGPDCDGQILVTHDLIGMFPWFTPRFVQPLRRLGSEIRDAVFEWKKSLKN